MRRLGVILTIIVSLCLVIGIVNALVPQGPDELNVGTPTRKTDPGVKTDTKAWAGNVTGLNISAQSITQAWQGYFGNVTGIITLDDSYNRTLYDWTLADPEGEVYAANDTVTWTNIQCFNFTAT